MIVLDYDVNGWLVSSAVGLFGTYLYCIWPYGYFKRKGIPGPKPAPFIGNFHTIMKKGVAYADLELVATYGKFVGYYEARHPVLLVSDREAMKQIQNKDFAKFTNRRVFKLMGFPLDRGILSLEDDKWKHMRGLMSPVFTSGRLKRMVPLLQRTTETLVAVLKEKAASGEEFEAKAVTGCFAMDTIAVTMFGVDVDSQRNPEDPFIVNSFRAFKASFFNPAIIVTFFFPFLIGPLSLLGSTFIPRKISDFFIGVTRSVLRQRQEDPSTRRDDLIGLLQEGGETLSAEDIYAQALTFFFAGYETTATLLSFVLYMLALEPEWQERLRDEVNSLETADYESLGELRLMNQFINETLRMYPPTLRYDRVAKVDTEVCGIPIPRGMCVSFPVFAIHRDAERWPEPDQFRPERFETEPESMDFIPFGGGPRACIGMRFALLETKLALRRILQSVRVAPCSRTKRDIQLEKDALLKPVDGLWIKVEPL